LPLIKAKNIAPKFVWRVVFLYKLEITSSELESYFSSITILIPSLSLSSLISEIPSIFPELTSSASFSIQPALLIW